MLDALHGQLSDKLLTTNLFFSSEYISLVTWYISVNKL